MADNPRNSGKEKPMVTHAGRVVVGFGWVQVDRDEWQRWMIRRCNCCKAIDPTPIHWIDVRYDMCPNCLSQQVERMRDNPDWNMCRQCGVRSEYGSTLEYDEDDEFDDEDEGESDGYFGA